MWTVYYQYETQQESVSNIHPGNKGDWVFLWDDRYQISLIMYYPEERKAVVSLTKHFTQ